MPVSSRFVVLQLIFPAIAGLGIAYLMHPQEANSPVAPQDHAARETTTQGPLPDSPDLIRLAAFCGRTSEARQKLSAALAAGAGDEELAEWLAPILIADPGWLEQFITSVPEERRVPLIRSAIATLAKIQPDALWELLRRSPAALSAAKAKVAGDPYPGVELFLAATRSPLAAETIFDPGMHFTPGEIDQLCQFADWPPDSCLRVLEEWRKGRLGSRTPQWIRDAWLQSSREHPSDLEKLEQNLPTEFQDQIARFKAYRSLTEPELAQRDLKPEDLTALSKADLKEFCDSRAMSGNPIPLETLQELPPELRSEAVRSYVTQLYPFSADAVREEMGRLDELKLSPREKQGLLYEAGCQECNQMKNYDTAMEWFSRIEDESVRTKIQDEALNELMEFDPQKALTYIRQLPPGERRENLEKAAIEAQP